ncbi:putative diguanylate cyclase YedQ [Rubripirellula obstinata]|uniref:diguanylate cyclase n=1 Tax=Rubripirellula obstinata TaxID=406547 RepID=A0A5B1CJ35_9BACT|nr:diguanylate cyclase [Rubripirellula obstinata]KAA1259935.1 putative diguanylate cyclase YedQ [Rubripirellula obstinata]
MIWLDFLIALSCGGAGLACGWVMHAMDGIGGESNPVAASKSKCAAASSDPTVNDDADDPEAQRELVSNAADRLKSYAYAMAADVDAHQSKVQAVNNSLNESADASPEAVSEAIHQLVEANEEMQSQLQSAQDRIHEQALQIECAEKRAETDALTRVPNRGAFDRHFAQRHELGSGVASTLAMLDVDHFKKFNDVYGHRAGDEVLRIVAGMLHSRLNERGIVARFGGEEFAVILDDCDIDQASQYVEEARQAISQREIHFEGKRLRVTASAGLAQLSLDSSEQGDGQQCESLEQWMQRSDDGLYHSKEAGRDCGHWMDGQTPVKIELSKSSGLESTPVSKTEAPSTAGEEVNEQAVNEETVSQETVSEETVSQETVSEETQSKVEKTGDDKLSDDKTGDKDPSEAKDVVSENETANETASEETSEEAADVEDADEPATGPFASLPNRKAMAQEFSEMQERAGASVTTFVMAIRCHTEASASAMRSLLQVTRATLRNVDRLGYQDQSTLLVCMPSVDQETARTRGEQICRSAGSIGLSSEDGEDRAISIGVAEIEAGEDFDQVVDRSVTMANQGRDPNRDIVTFDAESAAAS